MKYTNKFGLPDAFVRAVVNDSYSKGKSDYSATGLSVPARATALIAKYGDVVEVDVTSRVAAIIGQGAHHIAERAARPGDLCEERLFAKIMVGFREYTISAQVDLYETDQHILYDWKTAKAFAFSRKSGSGKKPEWIQQLNVANFILKQNGYSPKALKIIAMLKDWDKRQAGIGGYPETEVVEVDIEYWPHDKTVAYITERITAHESSKINLPICAPAETWYGRRCGQWCDASSVCDQWKEAKQTGIIKGE